MHFFGENMTVSEQYQLRFSGIGRLYGADALELLSSARMMVVGIGGVGTWVSEALARSGVGNITLVDLDEVCVTNINRQIHALTSTVGSSKVEVMAERLRDINPEIHVDELELFLDRTNITDQVGPEYDIVIDATDAANVKSALIAYCKARKIRVITVGSAGGKSDPTKIECRDLGKTLSDPMMAKVRQQLYRWYNFSRDSNRRFGVDTVYSTEQAVFPKPDGSVCQQKAFNDEGVKLDCTSGFGSSTMLTGSMGFVAANKAIERYLSKKRA